MLRSYDIKLFIEFLKLIRKLLVYVNINNIFNNCITLNVNVVKNNSTIIAA
ncbi:hypothetical protein EHRUM1_05140 [Ehrlichia ruminantium]|nr:hypothetical protein EHRUM1_05140 [Ehrlichia ruminantium]